MPLLPNFHLLFNLQQGNNFDFRLFPDKTQNSTQHMSIIFIRFKKDVLIMPEASSTDTRFS